jgi:hypothetical protein
MNIQINCNDKVTENELRYIFHNVQGYINQYENEKNNWTKCKYKNGKWV